MNPFLPVNKFQAMLKNPLLPETMYVDILLVTYTRFTDLINICRSMNHLKVTSVLNVA